MIARPGSFLWLVAHDVRLNWRAVAGMLPTSGAPVVLPMLAAAVLLLHLLAWPAVYWLSPRLFGPKTSALLLAGFVGGVFSWMTAQSLFSATRTLYDRADLDLLLGSPMQAAKVIAAKVVAIAASTLGSLAIIFVPIANTGALVDRPAWLGLYPALAGLAMVATGLALSLAMALFVLVGPRRARVYAHLTGATLGGAFVLGGQVFAMLPLSTRTSLAAAIEGIGLDGSFGAGSVLATPIAALRGDPAAMVMLVAIGGAMLFLALWLLGARFAEAAISAAGAPHLARSRRGASRRRFLPGAARNLRRKEWRLMLRDHSLFAQLALQIIYTIPIAVVLLRSGTLPPAFAVLPTLVVIAAQLAGSIAWVTVSAEHAPELIQSAPVTAGSVDRAKLGAVALPVFAILAIPLAGLALSSWRLALLALLLSAAAGTSTALLNFWHPMPGNRRGMLRRHSQSKVVGLAEHALAMLWALAAAISLMGSIIVLFPLALILGVLAIAYRTHQKRPQLRHRVTPAELCSMG